MIDEKQLITELEIEIGETYNGDICYGLKRAIEIVESRPLLAEFGKWIPVSERLPKEHESVFKKFKGTSKWTEGMFEGTSKDVNVTIELADGTRITRTSHTLDGRWECEKNYGIRMKVIAWQPLPEAYKGDE